MCYFIITQHDWLFLHKVLWFSWPLFAQFYAIRISQFYLSYAPSMGISKMGKMFMEYYCDVMLM